jgi:hypothetical protein
MAEGLGAEAIVRRIGAFGLPNGDREPALPPMEQPEWERVLGLLEGQRITGFAVAGAEAGWLSLSAEQMDELLEAHRRAMLVPLAVERSLLDLASTFDDEDVEFVVLKGPALAHTVYPNPSWRYFSDLDVLVRTEQWHKTCAILADLGYRRSLPEPREGFDARFGSAASFRREGGIEVDLHRNLVLGPFGLWIESQALFEGATEFRLWDRTFKRLNDTTLQLHACIHASLGSLPPLRVPVRDVAQVAHYAQVDWEALTEWAIRWKLRAVVRHAFQTASDALGVGLPTEADRILATTPSRTERRALRGYVTNRRARGGIARSTLSAIPGLRGKAAYVRALIFPDRQFLAARSGTRRASYRYRWAVPFHWMVGRIRR